MKLIAESSSSKAEWCLIEGGLVLEREFTEGINPYLQTRKEISRLIRLELPESFFSKKIEEIYFYGAGCKNEDKKNVVKASLTAQFRTPSIIHSDIFGAARSLFQDEPGIACILSTGSNSCFYDGVNIVSNVESLGYILGDEGSGAVLGKMFLSDCLKGLADPQMADKFFSLYRIDTEEILNMVYSQPLPNMFLSSISLFLADNLDNEYVYELVKQNIDNFFTRNLLQYRYEDHPVAFIGSNAKIYGAIVEEIAESYDVKIKAILESSMSGLVDYHSRHLVFKS